MYKHFGKAVLRTPLFDLSDFLRSESSGSADLNSLIETKLQDPIFMEALYWASPTFYQWAVDLKQNKLDDARKRERVLHTLKKYIIRAASRCTPYGLFAGCAIVPIGFPKNEGVDIRGISPAYGKRVVRVDMGLLLLLVEQIVQDIEVRPYLRYKANSSLYSVHGAYRYMEYQLQDGKRRYQLNAIERTELLDSILMHVKKAGLRMSQLFDLIGEEVKREEKEYFIEELINIQLLWSDLDVCVTAENQLTPLIDQLSVLKEECPKVRVYLDLFELLDQARRIIEEQPLGSLPFDFIETIRGKLNDLGMEPNELILFQVDLWKPNDGRLTIEEATTHNIWKGVEVLSRFTPACTPLGEQLKQFKKLFLEKYDTQEIPLLEVLDTELGIGFPVSGSIGNIAHNAIIELLDQANATPNRFTEKKEPWHDFLQHKYEQLRLSGAKALILTDEELAGFASKTDGLADTCAVMCSLIAEQDAILLHSAGGSANALLGRFAYLDVDFMDLSEKIHKRKIANMEESSVLAEVIHLPEGRVGNVIRRRKLSDYEIPYLGASSVPVDFQVNMEDLLISIQYDQIVLRSKRLNKRIIPSLSSAHNYRTNDLPAYQFLCAIQHQGQSGLHFSWGAWAEGKKWMPQVRYGKVILQRANWTFTVEDYVAVLKSKEGLVTALKTLCSLWGVPSYVVISEGDNELFIDTRENEYLKLLWEEWSKTKRIKLLEFLFVKEGKPLNSGDFANQLVIPFYKDEKESDKVRTFMTGGGGAIKRIFPPGSEWVYSKVYCGAFVSDNILKKLGAISEELLEKQLIDQFFFIRYNDPHYHIRFRMHLVSSSSISAYAQVVAMIHQILAPYVESRQVWKIQMDTYTRELERYGETFISLSERLFFADSRIILSLLTQESFIEDDEVRLWMALQNLDNWLDMYHLELKDKISFTQELTKTFADEFEKPIRIRFDNHYRLKKEQISSFLSQSPINTRFLDERRLLFSKEMLPISNLASYIHMSMNRWFKVNQRMMEYAVYMYANKYYKSRQYLCV